ncbi:uncharacterized protein LOC109135750 [Beta vulgaris subsp. vulgaris]|uniref:uncharacterized protein LOC109135750 n=1 Tax=Beta vulgaris subsp. vulgaris TaxID=3555 RepID=UPI000900BF2A|nr:uncharacterized protein LOC109135750 [Beta vulgaris subsp. vulgaris]
MDFNVALPKGKSGNDMIWVIVDRLTKVGKVAYRLALPTELSRVHNVFHISQLRRYTPDKAHVLQPEIIQIDENLSYEERPIKIVYSKVRSTRNKDVKIVKVIWSNQKSEEATWEAEAEMQKKYPKLFTEVSSKVTGP